MKEVVRLLHCEHGRKGTTLKTLEVWSDAICKDIMVWSCKRKVRDWPSPEYELLKAPQSYIQGRPEKNTAFLNNTEKQLSFFTQLHNVLFPVLFQDAFTDSRGWFASG